MLAPFGWDAGARALLWISKPACCNRPMQLTAKTAVRSIHHTEQGDLPCRIEFGFQEVARLTYINALVGRCLRNCSMWQPISTAPFGSNLELAVIEREVPHALVFPCRRVLHGWVHAENMSPVHVDPTHWRPWSEPC